MRVCDMASPPALFLLSLSLTGPEGRVLRVGGGSLPLYAPSLLSSLELSDTRVYESSIRALLGTVAQFCKVGVSLRALASLHNVVYNGSSVIRNRPPP